jgi:C4-dicarboxylate transporter/malic acid transport protein
MDPSGVYTSRQLSRTIKQPSSQPEDTASSSPPENTKELLEAQLHEANQHGWRRICLNFTPSWFSVTMGTGIVSILLEKLPYNAQWLHYLAIIVFVLNIVLFVASTIISVIRYTVYRGIFKAMVRHPVQSLFLGTIPMGLATIVNMCAFVLVPKWGRWALTLTWTLWWIDSVIAISVCMFLPFAIMYLHTTPVNKLQSMTAVWLLPIVSTIVASASGGIVAQALYHAGHHTHAFWTMVTSYVLWGTGVPLAMVVLVMYFHRLTVHQLPPREVIVSVFLPLGPLGQGGFAVMQLGKVARLVLPKIPGSLGGLEGIAGNDLYVIGFAVAIIMWGYGLVWLFFAIASITRSKFPFNMGWWAFTFPLGVYCVSTNTLAIELPSTFFKVLGTILSIMVVVLWLVVSAGTAVRAWTGDMFYAPCAADFEQTWIQMEIESYLKHHGRANLLNEKLAERNPGDDVV